MLKRLFVCAVAASGLVLLGGCGSTDGESAWNGDAPGGSAPQPSPTPTPPPSPPPAPPPGPSPAPPPAGTAVLSWSVSTDTDVRGYRVYYGTSSRTYAQARGSGIDVGGALTYAVSNLQAGRTYYFAVTAYDGAGNESDYSPEVSKSIQ